MGMVEFSRGCLSILSFLLLVTNSFGFLFSRLGFFNPLLSNIRWWASGDCQLHSHLCGALVGRREKVDIFHLRSFFFLFWCFSHSRFLWHLFFLAACFLDFWICLLFFSFYDNPFNTTYPYCMSFWSQRLRGGCFFSILSKSLWVGMEVRFPLIFVLISLFLDLWWNASVLVDVIDLKCNWWY